MGATVRLTYSGPHTVVINESGPSDAGGYVAVGRYKLQKESVATVMTATEIVSFNSSQFGELRDGVITLSTWRGFKDRTLETGTDGGFFTPSIYLQKDPSQ
ncbi:MAG: hypothetical protein K0R17_2957 [Rariglobus sp.]|nr:hypothetical protein [Rariglobus sp.]